MEQRNVPKGTKYKMKSKIPLNAPIEENEILFDDKIYLFIEPHQKSKFLMIGYEELKYINILSEEYEFSISSFVLYNLSLVHHI